MRKHLLAAAVFAAMAIPASAAVIVDGNSYGLNDSFTINFNGIGGDPPAVIAGLTSSITFTVTGISGGTYMIGYLVDNTSSSPITNSRVSVFGFDVQPDYTSASVNGAFDTVDDGNVPIIGTVEFCATNVNCAGGGGGGVSINTAAADSDGTITLNFASSGDITLDNFFVRYQSIEGAGNVTSGVGQPTDGVPEPGTWALMLLGFGATGIAIRRNRRKALVSQLA